MNKVQILSLILLFFFSCTKYTEIEKTASFNHLELTPDMVTTELAVVNLKVNKIHFDSIHVNFKEEIEIPAYISIRRNGEVVFPDYLSEIKIKGSVSAELPLKSIGIKFDKTRSNLTGNILNVDHVLSRHSINELNTIRLRNSGNDFSFTMMKQLCYLELVKELNLNLDINYIEPAMVFVNDEFHGIMNINSEVNTNGISKLYNIKKSTITLAKNANPDQIKLKDGNEAEYNLFLSKIAEQDTNYFLNNLDIDNVIDYIIFETAMANWDWPYNNVRFYKTTSSKWRFALFDLDNLNTQFLRKSRLGFIESTTPNRITDLFLLLLENEEFKEKYENRYSEIINSPILNIENFNKIIDENSKKIEPVMPYQIQKYGVPNTLTVWYLNVEELKSNYSKRHRFLVKNPSK